MYSVSVEYVYTYIPLYIHIHMYSVIRCEAIKFEMGIVFKERMIVPVLSRSASTYSIIIIIIVHIIT